MALYREVMANDGVDRSSWRLLPGEQVRWVGRPTAVARERLWVVAPVLLFAMALVSALFAVLMRRAGMTGMHQGLALASALAAMGVGSLLVPRHLRDDQRYLVTDRRVLWRRGTRFRFVRIEDLTYARIRWNRSSPVVGHLELVVATPFGPLLRRLRMALHDIREPDVVLALIRGEEASENAGDRTVPLIERLERGEQVRWGGHPRGWHLGWREGAITLSGVALILFSMAYFQRTARILLDLEGLGLQVRSAEWALLFSAVTISWVCIAAIGIGLAWSGCVRAYRLGEDTEYLLTDRRLLIRRGEVELSVDRRRIVDAALQPAPGKQHHLFLLLDSPQSRALSDSGAMGMFLPARDAVPPVLFELAEAEQVRSQILCRDPEEGMQAD